MRAHIVLGLVRRKSFGMEGQVLGLNGENNAGPGSNMAAKMNKDNDEGKLFVGALSKETTVESMKAYFSSYGEVIDCNVKIDAMTKRPRGFGFVQFKDPSNAQRVLSEGPHVLDGKKIDPKKASPVGRFSGKLQSSGAKTKKIFVGGLKPDAPEDIVRNYFCQYGTVVDVDLVKEKETNRRRGFCFVEFDSEDVVDLVMQKQYHDLAQGIKVEVKPALTKEQQAAKKAQEFGFTGVGRGRVPAGGYGYPAPGPSYQTAFQQPSLYAPYADPNSYPVAYPGYGAAAATYGAGAATGYEFQSPSAFGAVRYPEVGRGGYGGVGAGSTQRYHPYAR